MKYVDLVYAEYSLILSELILNVIGIAVKKKKTVFNPAGSSQSCPNLSVSGDN